MGGIKAQIGNRFATGTAIKTFLQILGLANRRVTVGEVGIGLEGVSNTAVPLDFGLIDQTGAGTASASTEETLDRGEPLTPQVVGQENFTVEPTSDDNFFPRWAIHPQTHHVYAPVPGFEIIISGALRIGLKAITAPGASINGSYYLQWEE